MPRETAQGLIGEGVEPLSRLDRLKLKRANFAREANNTIRRMDRKIQLLAGSRAEEIIREVDEELAD